MKRVTGLRTAAAVVAALTVAAAARAILEGPEVIDVTEHHLQHAVLILGGVATALLLARARRRVSPLSHPAWLAPALLAPLAAMALMVPTFYAYLNLHPPAHAVTHVGLVITGFLTAWCGERYRGGMGWATSILIEIMAVAAAFGWGVGGPGGA